MPNRDGTGPRGTGKRNLRGDQLGTRGECRRNSPSKMRQTKNIQTAGTSETVVSVLTTLFKLAAASVPVLLKMRNLLTSTNSEKPALPDKPTSKTIIIEPETHLTDKNEVSKNS